MDATTLILICLVYGILMFMDYFFKSCMMLPYLEFLNYSGISIGFFRLKFHTDKFNRIVNRHSSKLPSFYKHSFKVGFYFSLILFPIALFLMIFSLFTGSSGTSNLSETGKPKEEIAHLEILLPGVNLPLNQIGYYILALLICSVVHEAGHGIAAVIEDIPVSGFGMHLIFILPIAYTQIDAENLQAAKVWKKLKIFSAGIWNNLILAGWCYLLLLALPIILTPVYNSKEAVFIKKISPNAPVLGENGLYKGDSVYKINECSVSNENEWIDCLTESLFHQPAYCVDENFVHENEESSHDVEHLKDGTISCCSKNPALNCFENLDEERLPQYVCLNIRNTIEHAKHYCHMTACPEHVSCVKPILPNTTTIIHIKRKNRSKDFVYYGHPLDILNYVDVSNFVPKTKVFEPSLADSVALMLKYLIVFSSGLAILNLLPSYGLDGQFLVNTLITNLPSKYFSKAKKEILSVSINLIGSVTLFLAILKIIWTSFL